MPFGELQNFGHCVGKWICYNKHIAKKQIWAKRSELADTAFVTLCFSMEQSQRNATSKPNGAEVQLPPHYSHNGCRFLAK